MPTRAHANRIRTATDFLLVAIFALGIGLPALGLLWRGSDEDGLWENRRYASAPRVEFTLASLSRFPKRFEAYFNDHFALRRLLIRWDNVIRTVWLAASPQPGSGQSFDGRKQESQRLSPWNPVVLGSDSWFYWFSGEMLEDYRGLRPFDTDQLNEWRCNFEVRRRALAQRRIPYLLVIAPEKHEIYPEYLPANIRRVSERTRLDEFLTFMERRSELEILDLRAPLRAARGLDPVYYRTGTHWNEYGAYVASRAIEERLEELIPGFSPVPMPPFEIRRRTRRARRLPSLFGIADHYADVALELAPKGGASSRNWLVREDEAERNFGAPATRGSAGSDAPRAVMLHDSFTRTHLGDFLSRHFERIDFKWTTTMRFEQIDSLRPDVVIEERASRFLINSVPEESAAQARCVLDAMPRSSLQHSRDAGLPPAASASILARHRHST